MGAFGKSYYFQNSSIKVLFFAIRPKDWSAGQFLPVRMLFWLAVLTLQGGQKLINNN